MSIMQERVTEMGCFIKRLKYMKVRIRRSNIYLLEKNEKTQYSKRYWLRIFQNYRKM